MMNIKQPKEIILEWPTDKNLENNFDWIIFFFQ